MAQPTTLTPATTGTPDPQRSLRALEIQAARGLSTVRTPSGKFRAERSGRALDSAEHDTPAEALEAGEAILSAAEARTAELSASRHLENVGRAVYVPWPVTLGGTGTTAGHIEWQVQRAADRTVLSRWGGLVPALVEIGRLLSADDADKGKVR